MVSKIYYVRQQIDSLSEGYLAAVRVNYTFAEARKNIKMNDTSDLKINTTGPENDFFCIEELRTSQVFN